MGKEAVVHIYNGILLSHKNKHIGIRSKEVDELEPIIQSEISQKEKNKYCLLTYIYGIYKGSTDGSTCRAAMEMQT